MYVMSQVRPRRIFQQLKKPMAFGLDFEIGQLQLWHNNLFPNITAGALVI